jgi:hypothetical protein
MIGGRDAGIQQGFKAAIKTGCDASTTTKLLAGVRSVAPEALGGAIAGGAAYYHTGDLKTAVEAAGLGMMGGSLLRAVPGVRRFADPTRGVCFAPRTTVRLWEGTKRAESIVAGDIVQSRRDDDPNAPIEPKVVEEVFVRIGVLWRLELGHRELECTAEHPFWVEDKGWMPCHLLEEGDRLASDCPGEWLNVTAVEETGIESKVYNFRVADYHTYFVGDASWGLAVWAHNRCAADDVLAAARAEMPRTRLGRATAGQVAELINAGDIKAAQRLLDDKMTRVGKVKAQNIIDKSKELAAKRGDEDWGQVLRDHGTDALGASYPGKRMPNATHDTHAHHILPKEGLGAEGKAAAAEGQALLQRNGIDPFYGKENLAWAPNHGHPDKYVVDAVNRLKKVEERMILRGKSAVETRAAISAELQNIARDFIRGVWRK